jgi:hypothetical protein
MKEADHGLAAEREREESRKEGHEMRDEKKIGKR